MSQKDIAAAIGESLNYYKGAIVTIIDRSTDWLVMRKLPHGKDANEAVKTIVHLLEPYRKWIKTITTDN